MLLLLLAPCGNRFTLHSFTKGLVAKKGTEKLIHALVFSRLDYCNGVFTGLNKTSINQLQLFQNAENGSYYINFELVALVKRLILEFC